MAPSSVNPLPEHTTKRIPTEAEVLLAGGVWAMTSAKRDKLAELKLALPEGQDSLNAAATKDEILDLYLTDGLQLIAKITDLQSNSSSGTGEETNARTTTNNNHIVDEFNTWINSQHHSSLPDGVNQTELESKLQIVSAKITSLLERIPSDRCLRHVRDFLDPDTVHEIDLNNAMEKSGNELDVDNKSFEDAVNRFRLLLVKSAVDQIQSSWNVLTTVSDADIDRAAVKGIAMKPQAETVSLSKVYAYLEASASGTCSHRVTAAWNLLDRDEDGLLDEKEMNEVAFLCLDVEKAALINLLTEALDAYPCRAPLPEIGNENQLPVPKGWRQRRKEKNVKKKLLKMFQLTCKNHFRDEVEVNHRLRCIYAWAEKADQDNKIESVLVDADGWSGRKRYVELSPKISEAEFREVQGIHFTHLDRIGTEILKSFREDLWVAQGKRRERKDLARDCFLFLTVVSAIDFVILSL
jgi:hypothetical protein